MTIKEIQQGGTIGILCPSSPIGEGDAEKCKERLEALGYNVVVGKSAVSRHGGYLAGDDQLRADDINRMFADPSIDGIFCIRGGYGSSRVMQLLDIETIKNNPKVFVGYSDITNLHVLLNQSADMPTLHGPMVYSNLLNDGDAYTMSSFFDHLKFPKNIAFSNPEGVEIKAMTSGVAEGKIVGGNLAILVAGIGTPYELDTAGKLLFIEEIGESSYRVDRMLQQLIDSGKIDACNGLIFGDFNNCEPRNSQEFTVEEVIKDKLERFGKPMLYNLKSGHCKPMGTIPFGVKSHMDAGEKNLIFNID